MKTKMIRVSDKLHSKLYKLKAKYKNKTLAQLLDEIVFKEYKTK